jgi:glycosyltransferase involved in cell wall biosynthesis
LWRRKRKWTHLSVAAADVLTVQTAALADAIAASGVRPREKIKVIPHGPGWVNQRETAAERRRGTPFRIGYVTKWGVQKNFATLFRAIQTLARESNNIRLVLTLNERDPQVLRTLALAQELGLAPLVENHGEIGHQRIEALYDTLDAFAFPSLCESFGLPMVEAMARGLPVVAADTAVNREITAEAGHFFAPDDAAALAALIRRLWHTPQEWRSAAQRSLARGRGFSWPEAALRTISALEEAAGRAR